MGTGGGALGQGLPGGAYGLGGQAGNVGGSGRTGTPSAFGTTGSNMFGSQTGQNGAGGSGMFNTSASPFGGQRQLGNAPIGTPSGDLQNGGLSGPYGTPGGNGIYAGNTSGYYTYPGGWGWGGNTMGGGYAYNDIGSRTPPPGYGGYSGGYGGYSAYYGNNNGLGFEAAATNPTSLGSSGLGSSTLGSQSLGSAGLNYGNGNTYSGSAPGQGGYPAGYSGAVPQNYTQNYNYGLGTETAPSGPGVGNLGYPNAVTYGAYPGANGTYAQNPQGQTAGPSGNYAPAYYGNNPQSYTYGMGAQSVQTGPGVGAMGYPNPITPGLYPAGSYGWY